jgi:hypothetical protein
MHGISIWAAWYVFLLAVPVFLLGSVIREKLAQRRIGRRRP